ncbi:MAG: AzlC family ABC transporter permease [Butyricicoccus sp.]|nr:AzlC family ABC transporter permease [Butyricicoccus sp.]
MTKKTAKAAFVASIPVMTGYLVMGIAFGILLAGKGYGWWWAAIMGLTIYGGSMQFVAVNLLSSGATVISTAVVSLLVQARHLFYGVSMLERYRGMGKVKPYLIFGMTDETYALACSGAPEGVDARLYYFLITLFDQLYWITGDAIGGMLGAAIKFDTTGMDFAMTALFIVIFTDQALSTHDHVPAAIGVASTLACLLIFGTENFLIPSMLVITALLLGLGALRKRKGAAA